MRRWVNDEGTWCAERQWDGEQLLHVPVHVLHNTVELPGEHEDAGSQCEGDENKCDGKAMARRQ